MEQPMIQTIGLKKYFNTARGPLHAVDDVNLSILKGQTLGVVGESGCGKSTLGRVILRLIEPTEGKVLLEGKDITKYNTKQMFEVRKQIQIIFQDPFSSLNPRMSVSEIIAEPIKVTKVIKDKKQIDRKVLELMDTVGLARRFVNTYPHELDGGRRQRIGIARALAVNPKFIVCDEPVSALDVSIQAQILNLMMDLQEDIGLTYMFITHDLSVVKHISTDIIVMYLGMCVEKAPAEKLFEHPMHPYTKALLDAIPVPNLSSRKMKSIIKGEVTSPVNPKPGCRFAARCPYVKDECMQEKLELKEVEKDHFVACIHV
ncbi:MAG: oligopeptide/dipeptide ABC transporter ATP-binding protein [Peptococcaceae bacterium]|nr:oligopeptide/dipeptide ABC transporter ATP-binding protein [Peptococcaceae bacterium]